MTKTAPNPTNPAFRVVESHWRDDFLEPVICIVDADNKNVAAFICDRATADKLAAVLNWLEPAEPKSATACAARRPQP